MSEMKLPRRLSSNPNNPAYHPCFYRVGVRVDGKERGDIVFYDMDLGIVRYRDMPNTSVRVIGLEPYFRITVESRQERRARETWEAKHNVNQVGKD